MRQHFLNVPKFGNDHDGADAMAVRVAEQVREVLESKRNNKGFCFRPSLFQYMDIVLNGKESLEEALAEISHQEVMPKRNETKNDEAKTPRKVLLLIRKKGTMQKLLYLVAS